MLEILNFISDFSDSRKIGRYTFKRSLIFKLETSAILKFYHLKFQPSSETSSIRKHVDNFF